MRLNYFLLAALASDVVSAGPINRRTPLSVGQLVRELSTLKGRDFCAAYVNYEPYELVDLDVETTTTTSTRSRTSRYSTTTTYLVGTLKKGTTTTWVEEGVTATETVTQPGTVTSTSTSLYHYTISQGTIFFYTPLVPPAPTESPPFALPLRRRQSGPEEPEEPEEPEMPAAIADSDPINISSACSRVLTKYPIYSTVKSSSTKTISTTESLTSTTTVIRTTKTTEINPIATATATSTTIIATDYVVHGDATVTETITVWTPIGPSPTPIFTTVTVDACAPTNIASNQLFGHGWYPIADHPDYALSSRKFRGQLSDCCRECQGLSHHDGACIGYALLPDTPGGETGECEVIYAKITGENTCPRNELGIWWDGSLYGQYDLREDGWTLYRGKCFEQNLNCPETNLQFCQERWAWYTGLG